MKRFFRRRKPMMDTRPCSICGLAPRIKLAGDYGRYCLFYAVRITEDEKDDVKAGIRAHCISDGNQFTWPVEGYTPGALLQWRTHHMDWSLKRKSIRVGAIVGVLSLIVATASVLAGLFR